MYLFTTLVMLVECMTTRDNFILVQPIEMHQLKKKKVLSNTTFSVLRNIKE